MRNLRLFLGFVGLLILLVILFTFMFKYLKFHIEGESYTLTPSFYWVLTTMSTVGYGDITFTSNIGRIFSVFVLVSGVLLVFIGLPYFFISFIVTPWIEEAVKHRIPRKVPANLKEHVIICGVDPVGLMLAEKLDEDDHPYYIVTHNHSLAETLFDDNFSVFFGNVFEEETYYRLNISTARMVFANQDATTNAHITLVIRQVSEIPIVALVEDKNSRDILRNAGCTHFLPVKKFLGEFLSNRTMAGSLKSSIVGTFNGFEIAKIPVYSTPFQGKTISSLQITKNTNVKIIGIWERTDFLPPEPNLVLTKSSILVLMGKKDDLFELDTCLSIYHPINTDKPVIIIGGGGVGLSVAKDLHKKNVPFILIEKEEFKDRLEEKTFKKGTLLKGDASKPGVLEEAGIADSPSIVISTNDDGTNNYLTVYCRMLNKDICIISRANYEKNLNALYKAGADFVVPYNMIGSNMVYNLIHKRNMILRTEGLSIFGYEVSQSLAKMTIKRSGIRELTKCNVFCLQRDGKNMYDIDDSTVLNLNDKLFIIGTTEQEHEFFNMFGRKKRRKHKAKT